MDHVIISLGSGPHSLLADWEVAHEVHCSRFVVLARALLAQTSLGQGATAPLRIVVADPTQAVVPDAVAGVADGMN
jgi:hypothetical protein